MYQTDPPRPPQETMPTMYDLPSELITQVASYRLGDRKVSLKQ